MSPVLLSDAMNVIRRFAPNFYPKMGIILGSGLSSLAEQIVDPITIPYQAIPGLSTGSVSGHASLMVLGHLGGIPVVCLKGRIHMYEGMNYDPMRLLVRLVKQMGAHTLIITGAAGSLQEEVGAGELMRISDHINFHPGNPLVGPNDESIGPRFVNMDQVYDVALAETLDNVASRLGITLYSGVYMSVLGPMFETPAEIRAYRVLGADAIGMSVVPEAILARHCGLHVVGLAAIVNLASGMSAEKISHEGTLHYGEIAARKLVKLIPAFIKEVGPELVT